MDATALTLDEAVATAATGDIWLFRGRSIADRAIQTLTNSPVNHVGMVVALDDLAPLLWHAELGRSLPDVWTGERQRGVQLHKLDEAVRQWEERSASAPGSASSGHDRAPPRGSADGGHLALRRPRVPDDARPGARLAHRALRRSTSLETVYCAELVATTYQHMGLLPSERPASWYDPGRFWSGDRLGLVEPFALGGEIAVR